MENGDLFKDLSTNVLEKEKSEQKSEIPVEAFFGKDGDLTLASPLISTNLTQIPMVEAIREQPQKNTSLVRCQEKRTVNDGNLKWIQYEMDEDCYIGPMPSSALKIERSLGKGNFGCVRAGQWSAAIYRLRSHLEWPN